MSIIKSTDYLDPVTGRPILDPVTGMPLPPGSLTTPIGSVLPPTDLPPLDLPPLGLPLPGSDAPIPPPLSPQEKVEFQQSFKKFMESKQGEALRKTASDPAKKPADTEVQLAYRQWVTAQPADQQPKFVKRGALMHITPERAGSEFKEYARQAQVDAAFELYAKSPEGTATLKGMGIGGGPGLIKRMRDWSKANASNPEIAKYTPALEESVSNLNLGLIDARRLEEIALKKKAALMPDTPEEEPGLFGKNKFGFIGAIIAGIAGFFLGGPVGMLLGGMLGFGLGGSQDSKGLMSGLFNPDPAGPTMAKPIEFPGLAKGQKMIMIKSDGKATQDPREAERFIVGRVEGKSPDHTFVMEGVAVRTGPDGKRLSGGILALDEKRMPTFEPLTGSLALTKGGNVDLTSATTAKALDDVVAKADAGLARRRTEGKNPNAVMADTQLMELVTRPANPEKENLVDLQLGLAARMEKLGVRSKDRNDIAAKLTALYADKKFRDLASQPGGPQQQRDQLLNTELSPGRSVQDALMEAANGGIDTLEAFKASFTRVTETLSTEVEGRAVAGLIKAAPPPLPVLPDRSMEGPLVSVQTGQPVDLKPAAPDKDAPPPYAAGSGPRHSSTRVTRPGGRR